MQLLDYLGKEDRDAIVEYVRCYANANPDSVDTVLKRWNVSKRTLFRALGKSLRVEVPIKIEANEDMYYFSLSKIYKEPLLMYNYLYEYGAFDNSEFVLSFGRHLYDMPEFMVEEDNVEFVEELMSYPSIYKGIVSQDGMVKMGGKSVVIPRGMKVMKAIRKVMLFCGYDKMDLFETWRNRISNLSTSKSIDCNLVFSIHPMDFLTMSDNDSGWSSCMSWKDRGGYSAGVMEMLNSNMAVVAYLKSKSKDYVFNGHHLPNMTWRSLVFVSKNLILMDKSYPYYNEKLSQKVLQSLSGILYDNLKWKYEFGPQLYHDLKGFKHNSTIKHGRFNKKKGDHRILVYMDGMYNDFLSNPEYPFWCMRNKVDRSKAICLSGPATCLTCGEELDDTCRSYPSELLTNIKTCFSCSEDNTCGVCGTVHSHKLEKHPLLTGRFPVQEEAIDEECLKHCLYSDRLKAFVREDDIWRYRDILGRVRRLGDMS